MPIRPGPVEEEVWEERIARKRPTIEKLVQRSARYLRDPEQCKLEIELLLWRSLPRFDPTRDWNSWANTIIRNEVRHAVLRDRAHPETYFSEISEHQQQQREFNNEDDAFHEWLAHHAGDTDWYVDDLEETIVFRVSIQDFLDMIARRFGEDCRMLQVAEALCATSTEEEAARRLKMKQKEFVRVLRTHLRACLERFLQGGKL